ncbi:MAG: DUF3883 domain-containing protein [candidate division Zixibacteria bacterium]|nr:DUF3883 domain-containing protein [candidate division Zixibacteria bacterium]
MALSNSEIENQAIKEVTKFVRGSKDVRRFKKGYDVKSKNHLIEVKGVKRSLKEMGSWRFVQRRTRQLLLKKKNFFIYIVDNVGKKSSQRRIYVLNQKTALKYLKKKPSISYTIKIPANERENLRVR